MSYKKELTYFKNQCIYAINIKNKVYYNYILELCDINIKKYPNKKNIFYFELCNFIIYLSYQRYETIHNTAKYLLNNYELYLIYKSNIFQY